MLDVDFDAVLVPGFELVPLLPLLLEGIFIVDPALILFGLLMPLDDASTETETPILAEMAERVSPDLIV